MKLLLASRIFHFLIIMENDFVFSYPLLSGSRDHLFKYVQNSEPLNFLFIDGSISSGKALGLECVDFLFFNKGTQIINLLWDIMFGNLNHF